MFGDDQVLHVPDGKYVYSGLRQRDVRVEPWSFRSRLVGGTVYFCLFTDGDIFGRIDCCLSSALCLHFGRFIHLVRLTFSRCLCICVVLRATYTVHR